jgi:hypothetical protein
LSGRQNHKHKRKNKKNTGAAPAAIHEIPTSTEVEETEPKSTFTEPDKQRKKRAVALPKIIRKPDPFDVALWGLIVTVIIAAIYFLQLRSMQQQGRSMQEQVIEMQRQTAEVRRQTEISERPWLSIEPKPIWLSYVTYPTGKQAVLVIRFSVKNVGKSVAKGIQIDAKMFPADPSMPVSVDAFQNQRDVCGHPVAAGQIGQFDLFPVDQPAEREMDIPAVPSAIDAKAVSGRDDHSRKFVGFYVVGCASYRYSFGTDPHRTFFAYHLLGPVSLDAATKPLILANGMPVMAGFEVGINVKKDRLGLMQELVARNDAD